MLEFNERLKQLEKCKKNDFIFETDSEYKYVFQLNKQTHDGRLRQYLYKTDYRKKSL